MHKLSTQTIADFNRDGAVCLPQLLDTDTLSALQRSYEWNLANPTSSACTFYPDQPGEFYQDLCHPRAGHIYRSALETSILADAVQQLLESDELWFLYEQVFLKRGAKTRRTPWHQDTPYLALDGNQIAVAWINFDTIPKDQSLEFVRGSHRATLYDGSAFDDADDTVPIYDQGLPRLPDIEADRSQWDIVSWPVEPGDVVLFHPSTLHGGGATQTGLERRTLSLRFFGDDAVYATRPTQAPAPLTAGLHDAMVAGQLFRHPAFPRLRPTPSGFEQIPVVDGHAQPLKHQIQT